MGLPIDPISLLVAGVGGLLQKSAADAAVTQQAETENNNTRERYRVAQENDRAAQAEAFEAQTDRSRKAARQLSMARLISAEGGGSLAARAMNINASAAEDFSRIDASLNNQRSSVRGEIAAIQTSNLDALAEAKTKYKANQIRYFTDVGEKMGTDYVRKKRQDSERELAEDRR